MKVLLDEDDARLLREEDEEDAQVRHKDDENEEWLLHEYKGKHHCCTRRMRRMSDSCCRLTQTAA